jgi:hypothetical protein
MTHDTESLLASSVLPIEVLKKDGVTNRAQKGRFSTVIIKKGTTDYGIKK